MIDNTINSNKFYSATTKYIYNIVYGYLMKIKSIKARNNGLYKNEVELIFPDSNIITIVGKNGSGKSLFIKALSQNTSDCYIGRDPTTPQIEYEINDNELNNIIDCTKNTTDTPFKNKYLQYLYSISNNIVTTTLCNKYDEIVKDTFKEICLKYLDTHKDDIECIIKEIDSNESIWEIKYCIDNDVYKKITKIPDLNIEYEELLNKYDGIESILQEIKGCKASYIDCHNLNKYHELLRDELKIKQIKDEYLVEDYNSIHSGLIYRIINNTFIREKFYKMSPMKMQNLSSDECFQQEVNKYLNEILCQGFKFHLIFTHALCKDDIHTVLWELKIHSSNTDDSVITEKQLSFGTQNFLKILSRLDDTWSKLLFIDEPETGLHPQLQINLRREIEKAALENDIKIIISTHSQFFCPLDINNGLYVSYRKMSNDKPILVSAKEFEEKYRTTRTDIQVYDLIGYIPYNMTVKFLPNGINVIVEGELDINYLEKWRDLFNIPKDEICFISPPPNYEGCDGLLHAYNNIKDYIIYGKLFISPDYDAYSKLLDDNKNIKNIIIPIGKENKDIESLFENGDIKYTCCKNKKLKLKKSNSFKQLVNNIDEMDEKTINNFKILFSKYGIDIH